jgi:hypothetical protein
MAIKTGKLVFYHIPRTGGVFVKEAMRKSGIAYARCRRVPGSNQEWELKREHDIPDFVRPEDKDGLLSFCFVRHPLEWYRSFWCYRKKNDYLDLKFPADRCWDDDFNQFVANVLNEHPEGFVTKLYQFYIGGDKIDFIGRQENLTDDLVRVLELAGETFDEEVIRKMKWHNIAAASKRYGRQAIFDEFTKSKVLALEKWVLDSFYIKES